MLAASAVARGEAADFADGMKRTAKAIEAAWPACDDLVTGGDPAAATAKLLALFPEARRTAAESFMLGNVLFEIDRKQSYALHQAAARAEPKNTDVVWEWAMEQHRAGEYEAALASYREVSKARPGWAGSYALQADCLLRLDRVDEALAAWRKSEEAPDGSIEEMESLVCAVHREATPHARRAALYARATRERDAEAAAELIALDCDWPKDWWNAGPDAAYLGHDLPAVTAALGLPVDDLRMRAMACAAECAAARPGDAETVKRALAKHRLIVDADHTLPANGGLLAGILVSVVRTGAVDTTVLQREIAPRVLEQARKGSDVRVWNSAIYFGPRDVPDEEAIKIEREGWRATGDARFAAGTLIVRLRGGKMAGDDAELAAALKQFPESGAVWRVAYEVARREGKLTRELLAGAAKAEFSHFSSFVAPATVVNRPRADYLREYFAQMRKLPGQPK
jgi:tetratricopeptide (TPR) repeat protein